MSVATILFHSGANFTTFVWCQKLILFTTPRVDQDIYNCMSNNNNSRALSLYIMKASLLHKSASTLLLILALTSFLEFQLVCSLPIRKPIQSDIANIGHVPSQGEGKETRKSMERSRRDVGLVGYNETAAGVIYRANEREYNCSDIVLSCSSCIETTKILLWTT